MDVRRIINDRKLTARSDGNASTMQHAARSRVRRGLSARIGFESDAVRHTAPRPRRTRRDPRVTRRVRSRWRHTLRHARQLALRSGVSGIRRILGCLCLCGRAPPAIRHHNMQPDSGTRSLAADVCLHMPYH